MLKPIIDKTPLWRYMSFARFVWLLEQKALWMCRIDLLRDEWEMSFSKAEAASLYSSSVQLSDQERKQKADRLIQLTREARQLMFVNCWTASSTESYAMWRIYCESTEGVAIQTTHAKLRASISEREQIHQVHYSKFRPTEVDRIKPEDVYTRKRGEFEFERECRIVRFDAHLSEPLLPGHPLPWDPVKYLDRIVIHPGADDSFRVAVAAVVRALAPDLRKRLKTSRIAERPAGAV